MEISHVEDGGTGSVTGLIYDAAMKGSLVTLDKLLKRYGEAVLCRFSLASFAETPLHLAALKGHLEFSKRLLELNPELATEQDAEKCTPLHLAAANGHDQVVRELLKANEKACLDQDQQGRVPLHLAAMRGRSQVVTELLKSTLAQESLKMKVDDGDGILHLCVKYNHLDVLKFVLASTSGDDEEVLKMTDSHGNTVLHLAVMLKQSETVRFLLELPRVKTDVVAITNGMEFSALDVLNHSPKDYRSLEIREILLAGYGAETVRPSRRRTPIGANGLMRRDGVGAAEVPGKAQDQGKESRTWKTWVWNCVKWLTEYRGDWMHETRGSLMTVSTIIATVTFAAAISPPGGVWQEDTDSSLTKLDNCPHSDRACYVCKNEVCVAGNAVLAYYYEDRFIKFTKYNMISFISSLVVVFLIIGGFPLSNKFFLWTLSLAMCLTVSFLGLTFLEALWLVIPDPVLHKYNRFEAVSLGVWATMICIVGLFLLARLSYWVRRMNHSTQFKSTWSRFNSTLFKAGRKRLLGHGSCNPCA